MFKINLSEKSGKTYKLELESEELLGKTLKEIINGKDLSADLEGYEFEITGASDKSGFPAFKEVEGVGLKKLLLTYGKGMKQRPKKEGKKQRATKRPKGLRLRKTVRGKVISLATVQINMKVVKQGKNKLETLYAKKQEANSEEKKE